LSLLKCLFLKQYNKTKKQTKKKRNKTTEEILCFFFFKNYSQDEIKIKNQQKKRKIYQLSLFLFITLIVDKMKQ